MGRRRPDDLHAGGICADDPVERAAPVAMSVEAADEVSTILVAEGDRDVLRGHFKLVDHVPACEVAGREVKAALPAGGGPDCLPVIGARAWRPVLTTQRDEAELAPVRQAQERVAGVRGQRRLAAQMVLGRVERSRGSVELLGDDDPVPVEIHALPAQCVKLAGAHSGKRGDLQPSGERWAGERAGARNQLPYLLLATRASYLATGEDAQDIRSEAARAARVLAEGQEWKAADALLAVASDSTLIAVSREQDEQRKLVISFDHLFTVAAVYGWGELYQRPGRFAAAARYMAAPYTNIDALAGLIGQHAPFRLMLPLITYAEWFGPLRQAVAALPERHVFDGGVGYSLEKDHRRSLFVRAQIMFGPDDCLEHLVAAVIAERELLRPKLLQALEVALRAREVQP